MTEKEWDDGLKKELEETYRETHCDWHYIWGFIKKDRKHQREEMKQEPGLIVELNEKVIKKVIEDWQKPYRWVAFPNYVCRKTKRKVVLVETNALRVGLLATLPTALVNAKGILKWREKKGD